MGVKGEHVHTQDADFTLLCCDVLDGLRSLPDGSVHCVVTSPPYWGLRDYSTDGQIGLEPTPDLYVHRIVQVFREVRRVLRADGTCWVNLGDSYAANRSYQVSDSKHQAHDFGDSNALSVPPGLKPKDLVGIPWRVAFALQADGWYLRSDIIWSKPNPMPESVTDRPTKAHEYVFLLSKGPRYFFDQEAVRERYQADHTWDAFRGGHGEPSAYTEQKGPQPNSARGPDGRKATRVLAADGSIQHRDGERWPNPTGRNVRSVWEIATQPYPEAHFATYPEELVRRCVLAGTSERGCCPVCGKPWEREVERLHVGVRNTSAGENRQQVHREGVSHDLYAIPRETLGWVPVCDCGLRGGGYEKPIPCTVLDPFLGSGTTAHVARKHGRRSIGIELNPEYCELAARRMQQQSLEFA